MKKNQMMGGIVGDFDGWKAANYFSKDRLNFQKRTRFALALNIFLSGAHLALFCLKRMSFTQPTANQG